MKNKKPKYEDILIKKIIEEAIIDCYSEYEQISGWACILEENISVPCKCLIGGREEAILKKIEQNEYSIFGLVQLGKIKIRIPIEDIKFEDKKITKYMDAYLYWRKNG